MHLPEYLMEALALGLFLISACLFGAALEHPQSLIHQSLPDPVVRRGLMGVAMGITAVSLILSPFGKRSGAHMNPAVTLSFLRLGKIEPRDAAGYMAGQFLGAAAGVAVAAALVSAVGDPEVNYVVTAPGRGGPWVALAAETAISFGMMTAVLRSANSRRLAPYTPFIAGSLVAAYITFEAPVSGMSMNPARTLGSALPAGMWNALWIYFVGPPVGMLLAAEVYLRTHGPRRVFCAKLHHHNRARCIFRCRFDQLMGESQ